jgi:hypothetical protein
MFLSIRNSVLELDRVFFARIGLSAALKVGLPRISHGRSLEATDQLGLGGKDWVICN